MSDTPGNGRPAPIDRSTLGEISGGDHSIERRMLTIFRKTNDADATALKEALERRDIASVTRASHRVMGASNWVGAIVLANICKRIARAGCANDWDTIAANRDTLYCELDRVNAYLDMLSV